MRRQETMKSILFVCTGNSARSIMAEAYMNAASGGRWRAVSAGSNPAGAPNPFALETLSAHGIPAPGARSKSWSEFAGADAPAMDVVVTVCDSAAAEACPAWPARAGAAPRRLHWSFPDPASAQGTDAEKRAAFEAVFADIRARIDAFLAAQTD
jgi:arsenate reductase